MRVATFHRFGLAATAVLFLTQCKTPGPQGGRVRDADASEDLETSPVGPPPGSTLSVAQLPTLSDEAALLPAVTAAIAKSDAPAAKRAEFSHKVAHYLAFLGLKPGDGITKTTLDRLLQSSTQFILCPDVTDWSCLEQKPWITPSLPSRVDQAEGLGERVDADEPLGLSMFFTNQWDVKVPALDRPKLLANELGRRIRDEGIDGIDMAIYGIDKADASMKPVFDALMEKVQAGVPVRGVFDVNGLFSKAKAYPYVFSVLKRASDGKGIFDDFDAKTTNLEFQYKDTPQLIKAINANAATDQDAAARLEWPGDRSIMHNKFFVFKKGGKMSLWTGTANVADTCMGSERNSNAGLFLENQSLAGVFDEEFQEMFAYQAQPVSGKGRVVNAQGGDGLTVGHFHADKTANTKRYFRFNDGVETAVHFAPTDDGEHRSILPALLSARAGDEVRVSMFGGSGLEFVRVFQYLQAKGVTVRLVTDNLTGSGKRGWLRDPCGNILDQNPYDANPTGTLVVRRSAKMKNNHQKIGTLTRKTPGGMVPELAIIGSQNWTAPGNDGNDENMLSFRRLGGPLEPARLFNEHFDTRIWAASAANEMKQGSSYTKQLNKPDDETKCAAGGDDEDGDTTESAP